MESAAEPLRVMHPCFRTLGTERLVDGAGREQHGLTKKVPCIENNERSKLLQLPFRATMCKSSPNSVLPCRVQNKSKIQMAMNHDGAYPPKENRAQQETGNYDPGG